MFLQIFFPIIERVTSPSTLMSVRWSFIILLKGRKLHFQRSYRKTCFFLLRKCSNNLSRKILGQGGGQCTFRQTFFYIGVYSWLFKPLLALIFPSDVVLSLKEEQSFEHIEWTCKSKPYHDKIVSETSLWAWLSVHRSFGRLVGLS